MIEYLSNSVFWLGLGEIILVNILLSGDNAVVIALAARSLPPRQQKQAVIWGSAAATIALVVLTIGAVELLQLPYLRLAGSLMLFWIAVQLLVPGGDDEGRIKGAGTLWHAIRTILIADLVMSLDNVLGVAAVAKGNEVLLILGLGISIPVIVFGSTLVLRLMERFPVIITLGAALLGWVAGEMLMSDPVVVGWIGTHMSWTRFHVPVLGEVGWAQIAGAVAVVVIGKLLATRATRRATEERAAGERMTEHDTRAMDLALGERQTRSS